MIFSGQKFFRIILLGYIGILGLKYYRSIRYEFFIFFIFKCLKVGFMGKIRKLGFLLLFFK